MLYIKSAKSAPSQRRSKFDLKTSIHQMYTGSSSYNLPLPLSTTYEYDFPRECHEHIINKLKFKSKNRNHFVGDYL